jgi:hypothetical protein
MHLDDVFLSMKNRTKIQHKIFITFPTRIMEKLRKTVPKEGEPEIFSSHIP